MRKIALAASGFALAIALSACGGEDGGGGNPVNGGGSDANLFSNAQQLYQAASEQTTKSKSSKFTMDMDMAGEKMTAKGEAIFDGTNTKMSMTMDMQGQQVEVRLVDKTMYVKIPGAPGGKSWVKMAIGGADAQQFDQFVSQSDPSKMLEYIKNAGKITKSEETTLDGQKATHYWIDLDFAKVANQMGGQIPPEQAKQLAGKVESIPMELWLNGDNLPMKVTMDMKPVMESAGMESGNATMTMTFTDWGTPVTIEAPPAAEVTEMPSTPGN